MKYPLYDHQFSPAQASAVASVVLDGRVSSVNPVVEEFEAAFANYIGSRGAVSCSSGTAALHLALLAAGVGPGDEVIIPDLAYVAVGNACLYVGAKPYLVDVDSLTWNISIEGVKRALSPKTKVLICVHTLGNACDMDDLLAICRPRGVVLIEDTCEALGGTYRERKLGSLGDLSVFSFYGNKTLTCGEGGMVLTNNEKMAERVRFLRSQATLKEGEYRHCQIGYNYRMTAMQAALGLSQMPGLPEKVERKRAILALYDVALPPRAGRQLFQHTSEHAAWLIGITVKNSRQVRHSLRLKGIETRPMFQPISSFPMYPSVKANVNSYWLAEHGIMLPSYPHLTDEDVDYICGVLVEAVKGRN